MMMEVGLWVLPGGKPLVVLEGPGFDQFRGCEKWLRYMAMI